MSVWAKVLGTMLGAALPDGVAEPATVCLGLSLALEVDLRNVARLTKLNTELM